MESAVDLDLIRLNLSNICRACLIQSENMKNLLNNEDIEANLVQMFVEISNFEVDKGNSFPVYLCGDCEEKLNASYSFREQCQRSNEILTKCLSVDVIKAVAEEIGEVKNEDFEDDVDEKATSDIDYEPKPAKNTKVKKKCEEGRKQTMRLRQFSYDEVSQAIEESKKKFFENTECVRCGFIGSNSRALSVHMSHLHKDLKERWCSHCNAEFDDLPAHVKAYNNEDLRCQFCSKLFQAKGHLTEHLRSHSEIRPYKCDTCDKCFISARHLKVHYRIHSNERPYKCIYCGRAFIQHSSLKNHMKQLHEKYSCVVCNCTFGHKELFDEHKCENNFGSEENADIVNAENVHRIVTDPAVAQNFCDMCNRKVRSLDAHVKQFHGNSDSKGYNEYGDNVMTNKLCVVCGKQFKNSSKLKVHMRVHTGEAPYKCAYCGKRVSTRNQLVVHERTHTGERPHICHICGKGFAQSSVLNTHMRLHTGRPEVCTICDQRFCRPAEVRLHMRKHTGEKPFLCTECGQAFIQRSHLMEHIKTHSDVRPYQCNYCERAFKQNSSLKSHIQIHLGHKPYRCNQCTYACRQSYSLTQHMKQHNTDVPRRDRPHSCLICQKSYSTVAMLTSHTDSVHNNIAIM